jgi:hypothetical protein
MNTTTTEIVLDEGQFNLQVSNRGDDTICTTWTIDAPNGLWFVTDLEDGDFLVEGPTHHFEDIVLEGEQTALDYVVMMGVDRRRTAAKA